MRLYQPRSAFLAALLACLGAALFAAPGAAKSVPSYFNSVEVERTNVALFTKWTGMLKRYGEEQVIIRNCKPSNGINCTYDSWNVMLKKLAGKDSKTQLDIINRQMNEEHYIIDPINWGVEDYWATPGQFFIKEGDCEDYAIAKYMSLRRLGFDRTKMRIVVLQDLNLGIAHAILVVQLNGRSLVLDNQIPQVVDAASIRHYKPFYSINEDAWWMHRS